MTFELPGWARDPRLEGQPTGLEAEPRPSVAATHTLLLGRGSSGGSPFLEGT